MPAKPITKVLDINPDNIEAKKNIANISQELNQEKKNLRLKADTLLRFWKYEEAKNVLFSAFYLDQKDMEIWDLINKCNVRLKQDSITLEAAIDEAKSVFNVPKDSFKIIRFYEHSLQVPQKNIFHILNHRCRGFISS